MENKLAILLVEDDPDDRQLFKDAVNEIDETINLIFAVDGITALNYLKNESSLIPDFIFLDLRMPGINGEKCLEEIKKMPVINKIPVIVYTTSREIEESIRLKQMGAAHFLSKPTEPEQVFYMISMVLSEKWQ